MFYYRSHVSKTFSVFLVRPFSFLSGFMSVELILSITVFCCFYFVLRHRRCTDSHDIFARWFSQTTACRGLLGGEWRQAHVVEGRQVDHGTFNSKRGGG